MRPLTLALLLTCLTPIWTFADDLWVTYEGKEGLPGSGKHIVLISGDEEYRSEEAMPLLGKILAQHHGFKCTVLFAIDPETGTIDPNQSSNIPGTEALNSADMMILGLRFRDLPAEQMKPIDDFVQSGKPIMGLRTSTHAFNIGNAESPYKHYHWKSADKWIGGFGQAVLGETWISHHGKHKKEGTRGVIEDSAKGHPILNGVDDVFGATDVYGVKNLDTESDAKVLMWGAITESLEPNSAILKDDPRNQPMMPVFWLREFTGDKGKTTKVITTTMGSADDLKNEDLRRMLVNAVFWATGLEVPEEANVATIGDFNPSFYGFQREEGYWLNKGLKPSDFKLE